MGKIDRDRFQRERLGTTFSKLFWHQWNDWNDMKTLPSKLVHVCNVVV